MSTQNSRSGVRGYRRRKVALNLDLNSVPPGDNRDQEGTSIQVGAQNTQSRQQGNSVPPPTIDVEAIDDDVIESSPRAFAAVCHNLFFWFTCHGAHLSTVLLALWLMVIYSVMCNVRLKTIEEPVEGLLLM